MSFRHNYRSSNNNQKINGKLRQPEAALQIIADFVFWPRTSGFERIETMATLSFCLSDTDLHLFCEETHRCGLNKATWKVQGHSAGTDFEWPPHWHHELFCFLRDCLLSMAFINVLLQIPSSPAFVLTLTDMKQSHNIISDGKSSPLPRLRDK